MNIKISVAYHKQATILKGKNIFPLHVGKALSNKNLGIQGDDTGDSISTKNPLYCELTGIYWLWKNVKADYYGLMHYRRIFTLRKNPSLNKCKTFTKRFIRSLISPFYPLKAVGIKYEYFAGTEDNYIKECKYLDENIEKVLSKDINLIVPEPQIEYIPVSWAFMLNVPQWGLRLITEIISKDFPDFIIPWHNSLNSHKLYQHNMFIMDYKTFDDYCTKLFHILQEHERRSVQEHYINDLYNEQAYARLSGYIAELITSAYIQHCITKSKKIKTLPLMIFDNSVRYKNK